MRRRYSPCHGGHNRSPARLFEPGKVGRLPLPLLPIAPEVTFRRHRPIRSRQITALFQAGRCRAYQPPFFWRDRDQPVRRTTSPGAPAEPSYNQQLINPAPVDRDLYLLIETRLKPQSCVQHAKGWPNCCGPVGASAMASETCSGWYVTGRPERGQFCNQARPSSLDRLGQARTVISVSSSSRAMAGTRRPAPANKIMRARSTSRAGAARQLIS
jgi:hypothetical protein